MMSKIFMLAMIATAHAMTCDDAKSAYERGSLVEGACCPGGNGAAFTTPKRGGCGTFTIIEEFIMDTPDAAKDVCANWNYMAGANGPYAAMMGPFTAAKYSRFELFAHDSVCTCIRDLYDASNATITAYETILMHTGPGGFMAPVVEFDALTQVTEYGTVVPGDPPADPYLMVLSAVMGIREVVHKWFVPPDMADIADRLPELAPNWNYQITTNFSKLTPGATVTYNGSAIPISYPVMASWDVYVKSAAPPDAPGMLMGHDNRC